MILRQTAIRTYLECPLRFRFEYLDQIPRQASPALAFGRAFHRTLERLHREQVTKLPAAQTLFEQVWTHTLTEDRPRFENDTQEPEYAALGQELLAQYLPRRMRMKSTELNSVRMDHHYNADDTVWGNFLDGDGQAHQTAREALFRRHSDLAEAMFRKHSRTIPEYRVDPEDIRSAALEGLLYAVDHFDRAQVLSQGSLDQVFRKFASRCIFGFLMDELIRQDILTKPLLEQMRQFRREQDRLAQELGRGPTGHELRREIGCRDERRFQLLEALSDYQVNMENLPPDEGGRDEPDELGDQLVTFAHAAAEGIDPLSVDDPYAATELILFREELQTAIETLPTLQQQIIHVRYFMNGTLSEMSQDVGISRQTLSRHHTRALHHLHDRLTTAGYDQDSLPDDWRMCR